MAPFIVVYKVETGILYIFAVFLFCKSLICCLQVAQLMVIDHKRAVSLLLIQYKDLITPAEAVSQHLAAKKECDSRYFLYEYLHALFEDNPHAGRDFHDMQVH